MGLLATSDEPEAWIAEEEAEKESPGVNLADAMLGGGLDARYLESILLLEDVTGPNFPDPEPRRLHLFAEKNTKPIFFIEPSADEDDEWLDLLEREATKITNPWTLFKTIFQKGRYRRMHLELTKISKPIDGMEPEIFIAGSLAGAWWFEQELRLGGELTSERDSRLAARIRGALAELRKTCGRDDVVMILPHHLARRDSLLASLDSCNAPEHISCVDASSAGEEE